MESWFGMSSNNELSQSNESINLKMLNEDYFEELSKRIARFKVLRKEAITLAAGVIGEHLFKEDLFFSSAIGRTVDILDGISNLLETRNLTCAGILVRIQLDNLMRVFAAFIAADRSEFIKKVLKGIPVRKLYDDEGNKMTDYNLRKRISVYCPEIDDVYVKASGYVHFSDIAIHKSWWGNEEDITHYSVGHPIREEVNPLLLEIADAFIYFVEIEFELYDVLVNSKENADKKLEEQSAKER